MDHLLRVCPLSVQVWAALHIPVPLTSLIVGFKKWLIEAFHVLEDRDKNLLAISIWALRFTKNKIIHDGICQSATKIAGFVLGYLEELKAIQSFTLSNLSNIHQYWRPPDSNII